MRSRPLLALFSCSLLLAGLGACDQFNSKDGSKKDADVAASSKDGTDTDAKPTGPCATLESKLCEKTGKESALCAASKQLLPVLTDAACQTELAQIAETFKKLDAQRKDCGTLMERLCAQVEPDTCTMVKEATARFPPEQCTGMLAEFDRVLAELKSEEAKKKPVEGELLAAMHALDAPSFGPKDAKVTVVEFSDFECPYCSKAADVAHQIQKKYSDVRFVFRQFPLSFHKQAHKASQAALAADSEGKFWEFHDQLFQNQKALEPEALRSYAKNVGVSDGAIKEGLEGDKYAARVDADIALGNKVGVSGTPSMFVNGKRVANPTDFSAVSKLIDEQLRAVN